MYNSFEREKIVPTYDLMLNLKNYSNLKRDRPKSSYIPSKHLDQEYRESLTNYDVYRNEYSTLNADSNTRNVQGGTSTINSKISKE